MVVAAIQNIYLNFTRNLISKVELQLFFENYGKVLDKNRITQGARLELVQALADTTQKQFPIVAKLLTVTAEPGANWVLDHILPTPVSISAGVLFQDHAVTETGQSVLMYKAENGVMTALPGELKSTIVKADSLRAEGERSSIVLVLIAKEISREALGGIASASRKITVFIWDGVTLKNVYAR